MVIEVTKELDPLPDPDNPDNIRVRRHALQRLVHEAENVLWNRPPRDPKERVALRSAIEAARHALNQ